MAAPTVSYPSGSMNRLTVLIVTDGSDSALILSQSAIAAALAALKVSNNTTGTPADTALTAIKPTPPIVTALTQDFGAGATQADMRAATIDGPVKMQVRIRSGNAPAAAANAAPIAVDVDTDAGTATKLEVNVQLPTTACAFYLDMIAAFSTSDGPNCTP